MAYDSSFFKSTLPRRCIQAFRFVDVVVVLLLHLKRIRMILSSAWALAGRQTSSSRDAPRSSLRRSASKAGQRSHDAVVVVVVVVESPQTPEDDPEERLRPRWETGKFVDAVVVVVE